MKIANFLMAGAVALILTSCGGMSVEEAKDLKKARQENKLTTDQKKTYIENTIRVLNEEEFSEDFDKEYVDGVKVSSSEADAWAAEDKDLKDLVDELKKAEQENEKRQEANVKAYEEWQKENGLDK